MITQTTLSLDDVAETVDALGERFGDLRRPAADDICYATQNRQDAVKELASRGRDADPRDRLARRARTRAGWSRSPSARRDGAADRRRERHRPRRCSTATRPSALTAGASTPEELVALVLRGLASFGYDELGEVEVARENVHFRLPREVTAPA